MRWALLAGLLALLAAAPGCDSSRDRQDAVVVVGAAASLAEPVAAFAADFEQRHPETDVRLQIAGSDAIAAQIRQGVDIDVYVGASLELTRALRDEGRIGAPRPLAGNRLVVAALRESGIRSIDDLDEPGLRLAIGNPNVPVGAYARDALSLVGDAFAIRAMGNVRTNETDVRGIVGKLNLGVVDAGIVYRTDVRLIERPTTVIPFATEDQPSIRYAAAVVGARRAVDAAESLVDELTGEPGRRVLDAHGFSAR